MKKASKATCLLDPIPTGLLHKLLSAIAPILSHIVNDSLSFGVFPSEKSAIIYPLFKKPCLDCDVLKNFRPVLNLAFISKIIEKVTAFCLVKHMNENQLLDPERAVSIQSGIVLRLYVYVFIMTSCWPLTGGTVSFWCSWIYQLRLTRLIILF